MNTFLSSEQKLQELTQAYDRAVMHHQHVKDQYSFWEKTKDTFTTTKEEQAVLDASQNLDDYKTVVAEQALAWLEQQIDQSVLSNPTWKVLQERAQKWEKRVESVLGRLQAGQQSLEQLQVAVDLCQEAVYMTVANAFSKNPGIAYLSHHQTDNAQQALKNASDAVQRFQDVLKKHENFTQDLAPQDIHNDLSITMLLSSTVNFLALANVSKLEEAQEQCEEMHNTILPVVVELQRTHEKLQQEEQKAKARYENAITPLQQSLLQELPPEVCALVEKHMLPLSKNDEANHSSVHTVEEALPSENNSSRVGGRKFL